MNIEFQLNNKNEMIEVDPSRRLLDILRDDFGLTSVKEGCGEGECGACIILLDGKAVNSCLLSAGMIAGKSILTLEKFNKTDEYKLIEKSFLEAGSVQCGFCTSGMVMSTAGLLNVNSNPNETEIKEALSGNLCRCTGYQMIIEGVKLAVEKIEKEIPLAKSLNRKGKNSETNSHKDAKSQRKSLVEILNVLDDKDVTIISGGTDLMVKNAGGSGVKPKFKNEPLFIGALEELKQIKLIDNEIHIGSAVTLNELLVNENISEIFKKSISEMASFPTRNIATIGGNIINASPAGDTLPFLYAVDAKLVLKNKNNERMISIKDFILGPGKTIINSNELLTEIIIPAKIYDVNYYKKAGSRKGMTLSKASMIGMISFENNLVSDVRIAFGAVASTVVRSRELEEKIIGKTNQEAQSVYFDICGEYEKLIKPIDDSRSSKKYRKDVCLNMLRDFFVKFDK